MGRRTAIDFFCFIYHIFELDSNLSHSCYRDRIDLVLVLVTECFFPRGSLTLVKSLIADQNARN